MQFVSTSDFPSLKLRFYFFLLLFGWLLGHFRDVINVFFDDGLKLILGVKQEVCCSFLQVILLVLWLTFVLLPDCCYLSNAQKPCYLGVEHVHRRVRGELEHRSADDWHLSRFYIILLCIWILCDLLKIVVMLDSFSCKEVVKNQVTFVM